MEIVRLVSKYAVIASMLASAGVRLAFAQAQPEESPAELSRRVAQLTALVESLQARLDKLEARDGIAPAPAAVAPVPNPTPAPAVTQPAAAAVPASTALSTLLDGTTFNFLFDGYYGFNFNNPIGRVNLLRANDVTSNAFSLNQADLVVESAPDPDHNKRYGLRLDLQFGQATAALQGNANNEPRPDVYRDIFQAYGTYVFPVGKGLTVDFGKWASSLGIEGNYAKDQVNYSRSFLFDFLPFYHMGARMNYKVSDVVGLNYWITNGTQQTEPFNGFKDQMFGFTVQPSKAILWTMNYYLGQEHPDVVFLPNYTGNSLPTEQGLAFEPIVNPPSGKLHIFDSYLTWQASPKLNFALEGDYVLQRLYTNSAPDHTSGEAFYARYQFTPAWAVAARTEYIADRGGLFSGTAQDLKENTLTVERKIAETFLMRAEWRRDASNHAYFLSDTLGLLKKDQNTATLGLVWWFGAKTGIW